MTPPAPQTLFQILSIIEPGGVRGVALSEISARYRPGRRRKLSGMGALLSLLTSDGYVQRCGRGAHSRFRLAPLGAQFVATFAPQWESRSPT